MPSNAALFEAAHRWAALNRPDARVVRIALYFDDAPDEPGLIIRVPKVVEMPTAERATVNGTPGHAPEPREIEAAILTRLTDTPVEPKRLAKRCGYRFNSYFRAAITSLCRKRLLDRRPDGVCLPPASGTPPVKKQ